MAKEKICKGCGLPFEPMTSLQQTHQNFKCYKAWQKSKKKTKLQKLRIASGKDEDRLRRQNDALFQEICKKLNPVSVISGQPTEVIHHLVKKSHSNFLRYYIPNGIPLTNQEHDSLHNKGNSVELEISVKIGQERLADLNSKKNTICKLTLEYLEEKNRELREMLKSLV